jgi:hypothetical protein
MRRREFIAGIWWHSGVGVSCEGLGETGYLEDRNVGVEYHWLDNQFDRLPALTADLVRRRAAVIATRSSPLITTVAKAATATRSRSSSASP